MSMCEIAGKTALLEQMDRRLLAQAKTINNLAVPNRVAAVQIVQQTAALVNHHDQPATRRMVLCVELEVRIQIVDPFAQKSDLHFRRSRVFYMSTVLFDQR